MNLVKAFTAARMSPFRNTERPRSRVKLNEELAAHLFDVHGLEKSELAFAAPRMMFAFLVVSESHKPLHHREPSFEPKINLG
jgi:hypothetical protein